MNTQQQYAMEMQARYLKYLQKEDERDKDLIATERERKKNKKKAVAATSSGDSVPPSHRIANVKTDYKIHTIIIDSDFRDVNNFPNASDFVVKIQDTIKMVVAIRILKTEFYQPSNSFDTLF